MRTIVTPATLAFAVLATAAPAFAAPDRNAVTASYNAQPRKFCLTHTSGNPTDPAEPPAFCRPCRSKGQWLGRGLVFEEPVAIAGVATRR